MATPILNITEISASQQQKEVTANAATRALEAAANDFLALDFTSGNITLTDAQFRSYANFKCTNVSVARDLTVSAIKRRFMVDNTAGTAAVSVKRGTATIVIAAGSAGMLWTDGTTNHLSPAGASGTPSGNFVDLGLFFPGGPPASSELILKFVAARDFTFPEDFLNSVGDIGTNPTATFDLDVSVNGASIGTISISTGGVFTFSTTGTGTKQVAAGSVIDVTAPASTDATAADIAVTLKADLGLL